MIIFRCAGLGSEELHLDQFPDYLKEKSLDVAVHEACLGGDGRIGIILEREYALVTQSTGNVAI